MDPSVVAIVAFGVLAYSLVSKRIERSPLTAPMIFLVLGLLVGEGGLALVQLDVSSAFVSVLAELTLILVLYTDAARIDLTLLRRDHDLPIRLLAIGLPLTIVLGAVAAVLIFGLGLWEAAVLGVIIAPTDAALGQAVVSAPEVPARMRQTLNVESGLNDGLALPVLLLALSMAGAAEEPQSASHWVTFAALQLTLGPLVGVTIGYLGARLIAKGSKAGWISPTMREIGLLAVALLAFAVAEWAGGNGFIAAFCAGLTLGNSAPLLCAQLHEFAEAEGQLLTLLVFLVLGAVLIPDLVGFSEVWRLRPILFAISALTVVRMIPVTVSLMGTSLRWESILFLGWFGPRGIASVLYLLLVTEGMPLASIGTINIAVLLTVGLSIFAHGLTAYPAVRGYAARLAALRQKYAAEYASVSEMRIRSFSHDQ